MARTISAQISIKLANLAAICAILVAFIHAPTGSLSGGMVNYLSHGLAKIAVPFFFTAAGYLLANRFDESGWYKIAVVKRVNTLLLPLILWDFIYYVYGMVMGLISCIFHGDAIANIVQYPSVRTILRIFAIHPFCQPYCNVLWFVRVLFILVVCSPLIRRVLTPFGCAMMFIANCVIHPDYAVKCNPMLFMFQEGFLSIFGLAWFSLGMMLKEREVNLAVSKRVGVFLMVIGFAIIILRGNPYENYLTRFATWLAIPFLLVGVWGLCPIKRFPQWLVGATFPIYVMHMLFFNFFASVGIDKMLISKMRFTGYVTLVFVNITFCILSSLVARRYINNTAKVLFGGR